MGTRSSGLGTRGSGAHPTVAGGWSLDPRPPNRLQLIVARPPAREQGARSKEHRPPTRGGLVVVIESHESDGEMAGRGGVSLEC